MDLKRDIDADALAAMGKPVVYPIALVRIDWPDELIELHTGAGDVTHDGSTFMGTLINGTHFGQITLPSEQAGLRSDEISLTLYGPYSELLDRMRSDASGSGVTVWAGATTEPGGNTLIGVPPQVFFGTISGDILTAPTDDGSAALIVRAKAGTHGRVKGAITHSNEDQQGTYPTDTFFERNARASAYRAAPPRW